MTQVETGRWQIQSSFQQTLRLTKGLLTTSGVQNGQSLRGLNAPHIARQCFYNEMGNGRCRFRHKIVANRNEVAK